MTTTTTTTERLTLADLTADELRSIAWTCAAGDVDACDHVEHADLSDPAEAGSIRALIRKRCPAPLLREMLDEFARERETEREYVRQRQAVRREGVTAWRVWRKRQQGTAAVVAYAIGRRTSGLPLSSSLLTPEEWSALCAADPAGYGREGA